jgi:hypothetical protein
MEVGKILMQLLACELRQQIFPDKKEKLILHNKSEDLLWSKKDGLTRFYTDSV